MSERLFAVIPCAGRGMRAGGGIPKQYRKVAGRHLLYYALAAFDACTELTQTLLVLAPDDQYFDARYFSGLRFAVCRNGCVTRQASVLNGLKALAEFGATDNDWVLVHDAARPGVTPALIRSLIHAIRADRDHPIGGIVALPLTDTLKRSELQLPQCRHHDAMTTPHIVCTESREHRWLAQTPQMFRLGLLRDALVCAQQNRRAVTDEANALEQLGYHPRLVLGHWRNFKVTYPDDFETAQIMLSAQMTGNHKR